MNFGRGQKNSKLKLIIGRELASLVFLKILKSSPLYALQVCSRTWCGGCRRKSLLLQMFMCFDDIFFVARRRSMRMYGLIFEKRSCFLWNSFRCHVRQKNDFCPILFFLAFHDIQFSCVCHHCFCLSMWLFWQQSWKFVKYVGERRGWIPV